MVDWMMDMMTEASENRKIGLERTVRPAGVEGFVILHMQGDREVAHCVPAYEPARRARWQFTNREEERTESQPLEMEETKKSRGTWQCSVPICPGR